MQAEPPQNAQYMVAAYVVTTLIVVGYWIRLVALARRQVGRLTKKPVPDQ